MEYRKEALKLLINQEPTKIDNSHFQWQALIYQVKPYSEIKKKGKRGGNITKYIYVTYRGIKYGIWELTPNMVNKLLLDK